jgi:hypothetical protein
LDARALKISPNTRRDRVTWPHVLSPSCHRRDGLASLPDGQKPKLSKLHLLRSLFTLNRIGAHYLWEGRETQSATFPVSGQRTEWIATRGDLV